MVVSSKFPLGKKSFEYFMGYKVDRKVRPLWIIFSKMSGNRRDFDETKLVQKKKKKRFNSNPVYNEKYLKAKIKSYEGKYQYKFLWR